MLLIKKFNSTTAALAFEYPEVRPCMSWRKLIKSRQIGASQGGEWTWTARGDGIQLELGSGPPPLSRFQASSQEERVWAELQSTVLRQGKQGINAGFGLCPASLSSGSASATLSSCQGLMSQLLMERIISACCSHYSQTHRWFAV